MASSRAPTEEPTLPSSSVLPLLLVSGTLDDGDDDDDDGLDDDDADDDDEDMKRPGQVHSMEPAVLG